MMKKQVIAVVAAVMSAVFGIAILIGWARGADDRAYDGAEMIDVLQVTSPVPAGTPVADLQGAVETVSLPETAVADGALSDLEGEDGTVTTTDLAVGEQVLETRLGDKADVAAAAAGFDAGEVAEDATAAAVSDDGVPRGLQRISITVSLPKAVGASIEDGSTVGVYGSFEEGLTESGSAETGVIDDRVLVLDVSSPLGIDPQAAAALSPDTTFLITLAVDAPVAKKLVFTAEFGRIYLTDQNKDTQLGDPGAITQKDVLP